MSNKRIVIIGSGPAGWTAAVYAKRGGFDVTVVTGLQVGGQLMTTTDIENWPGGEEGLQAPFLMGNMQAHAERYGVKVVYDLITDVDVNGPPFTLTGEQGTYEADALIIATGSSAKWLGLPSEEAFFGKGVSACATCDGFFYRGKEVAVVGGGNTAIEEALYLSNIASKVYLVVRGIKLKGEQILIDRLLKRENIHVHYQVTVEEIIGDEAGVSHIVTQHNNLGIRVFPVHGVFIAIGHTPNVDLFEGKLALTSQGIIGITHDARYDTATSSEGIFAAGDVADATYRQAITSAGTGCKAALDAMHYLESR